MISYAEYYEPVMTRRTHTGLCPVCGKKRTRTRRKEPDVLAVSGAVAAMMAMIVAVISMAAGDLPRLRDSSLAALMGLIVIIIAKSGKDMEGKC